MNESAETFQNFLKTEVTQAHVVLIAINLVLAAAMGIWLGKFYVRYGTAISNRAAFARNFVLLTMTTALIITLIQKNVALSLGMIGALSIVRFRSAIKEPEELGYLFLSIAVGMGLGANQQLVTIGGLAVILFVLWIKARLDQSTPSGSQQNLFITVTTRRPDIINAQTLNGLLTQTCSLHRLKRIDQTKETTEACYLVEPKDGEGLSEFEAEIRRLDEAVTVSMLDTRGGLMGMG